MAAGFHNLICALRGKAEHKMTQFTQRGKRARAGEKGWRKLGVVGLVLVLIFVCQFAMLGYFNLTQMRNHVGYDSSWNFLRSALMWDEKALS